MLCFPFNFCVLRPFSHKRIRSLFKQVIFFMLRQTFPLFHLNAELKLQNLVIQGREMKEFETTDFLLYKLLIIRKNSCSPHHFQLWKVDCTCNLIIILNNKDFKLVYNKGVKACSTAFSAIIVFMQLYQGISLRRTVDQWKSARLKINAKRFQRRVRKVFVWAFSKTLSPLCLVRVVI